MRYEKDTQNVIDLINASEWLWDLFVYKMEW